MKDFLEKNKDYVIIGILSIIAFIVGCLAIKPIIAFIIIIVADLVLFIPNFIKNRNKNPKGRHAEFKRKKSNNVKTVKKDEKPKTKKKKKNIWKKLIFIFLLLCIFGIVLICLFAAYIIKTSPKFDPKKLYHQEATTFYDIDLEEMGKVGTENREIISYDELPEVLIDAIIATEDSRFYQHNGVDITRFMKATFQTLLGSSNAGGASTLTMQLVKNHYTSKERSIVRKFKDVYIAVSQVEKKYTKEEILEFYVNAPYLGGRSYGVEQACRTYFGKSAKDINLAEAAMIAGLFQSPGADDPTKNPERAEKRRQTVLKLMERHGYITKEEREIASKMTVDTLLANEHESIEGENEYQAFMDTVLEELDKDGIDPYSDAYEIYTTMHRAKQDHINKIMNGETWDWKDDKVTAGIAVVDVANGNIVAVGGGRDKKDKLTLNTATQLNKQIGSTAKPLYDYSIGIEYENWSTYEPMTDENITYSDGTELNNWDGSYMGYLTLRNALAQSRNTSAVKAFRKNKNANIREAVTKMGLHPEEYLHEAHAIGGYNGEYPVATAAAYATFGNSGVYNRPRSYYKIVNKNTGEVIEKDVETTKVFSPQTAYMMTDLLGSSAKSGLGNYSNVNGCTYGAKTGTSNFTSDWLRKKGLPSNTINDYWVSGVSPDYAISVWYGYLEKDIDRDHHNTFGTTYHLRLFQAVAKGVFKKESSFKNPGGVSKVAIENYTYPAKLPSEYTPKDLIITELFKEGTEPTETSDRFSKLAAPSNLKGTVEGNKLTLTWDGISTPNALDDGKINENAEKLFETSGFKNRFVSQIKSYNSNVLGSLVYRVYGKKADGSLEELEMTSNTSITLNLNESSPTTYVVKASYSIMTSNMSDGIETTISTAGVKDVYELSLVGEKNITTPKGTYSEEGVTITRNGEKTALKPTTITYVNSLTNVPVASVETMNATPGTYTVTYKYKESSVTRSVTIQ